MKINIGVAPDFCKSVLYVQFVSINNQSQIVLFQAKEKELGNQNIYAQRGRISSKRSHFRAGPSTQSNPNLSVQSFVSTTTPAAIEKREDKILKSQTSNLRYGHETLPST